MDETAPIIADEFDTNALASAIAEAAATAEPPKPSRRGAGFWWIALLLVIACGYLTAARRASLGRFVEQVTDIIGDFRGYDPEF